MPLKIVGAGFGRTGTHSLKLALEQLGFGPCHHMAEVSGNPAQRALWEAITAGQAPDWDTVFAQFNACVDWPAAFFWRELADHYPDAKVLLSVRPEESWYKSISKTILPIMLEEAQRAARGLDTRFSYDLVFRRVFDGRLDDHDHAIAVFRRHITQVQSVIAPERLLTYDVSQGWGPLCAFLQVPIPVAPFPLSNTTADFLRWRQESKAEDPDPPPESPKP